MKRHSINSKHHKPICLKMIWRQPLLSRSSFQSQIVYLGSETSPLHWKAKLRNPWGQYKHLFTLWRWFRGSGSSFSCCFTGVQAHISLAVTQGFKITSELLWHRGSRSYLSSATTPSSATRSWWRHTTWLAMMPQTRCCRKPPPPPSSGLLARTPVSK